MSVREGIQQLLIDPRIAVGTSISTTGTGLATILDWIPNDIGKLATLIGIILSVVLIYTHWRKGKIEYEKTRLEIELLKKVGFRNPTKPPKKSRVPS